VHFDTDGDTDFSTGGGGEVAGLCTVLFAGGARGAEGRGETGVVMAGDGGTVTAG
jgi:hypothetical protein